MPVSSEPCLQSQIRNAPIPACLLRQQPRLNASTYPSTLRHRVPGKDRMDARPLSDVTLGSAEKDRPSAGGCFNQPLQKVLTHQPRSP